MDEYVKFDGGYHWIFDKDSDRFEEIRQKILSENNRLRENYTHDKLVIEDHVYMCAFCHDDGTVAGIAGLKEISPGVARFLNRLYFFDTGVGGLFSNDRFYEATFPAYKSLLKFTEERYNYDLLFVSMQHRNKRVGQEYFWNRICKFVKNIDEGFEPHDGELVQVHPGELSTCYQYVIYKSYNGFKFEDWNPKTRSFHKHALRVEYETRFPHKL